MRVVRTHQDALHAGQVSQLAERVRVGGRSIAPGLATGPKVGFGIKRLSFPATSSRVFPSTCAHCMVRLPCQAPGGG